MALIYVCQVGHILAIWIACIINIQQSNIILSINFISLSKASAITDQTANANKLS